MCIRTPPLLPASCRPIPAVLEEHRRRRAARPFPPPGPAKVFTVDVCNAISDPYCTKHSYGGVVPGSPRPVWKAICIVLIVSMVFAH